MPRNYAPVAESNAFKMFAKAPDDDDPSSEEEHLAVLRPGSHEALDDSASAYCIRERNDAPIVFGESQVLLNSGGARWPVSLRASSAASVLFFAQRHWYSRRFLPKELRDRRHEAVASQARTRETRQRHSVDLVPRRAEREAQAVENSARLVLPIATSTLGTWPLGHTADEGDKDVARLTARTRADSDGPVSLRDTPSPEFAPSSRGTPVQGWESEASDEEEKGAEQVR